MEKLLQCVGLVFCPILGTSTMYLLSLFWSNSHLKHTLNHISSTLFLPMLCHAKELLIMVFSVFIHELMWFGWYHEKLIWLILIDNVGFVKWLELQVHFQLLQDRGCWCRFILYCYKFILCCCRIGTVVVDAFYVDAGSFLVATRSFHSGYKIPVLSLQDHSVMLWGGIKVI